MIWFFVLLVAIVLLFSFSVFLILFSIIKKRNEARDDALRKLNEREEFNPHQFLEMYNKLKINNIKINSIDQSGCYVFLNKTKNINYVGQSKSVLKRINQHLNGKGNGDLYADYKYGSEFIIFIIKCPENELNVTEKNLIKEFDAYKSGYNKNSGVGRFY